MARTVATIMLDLNTPWEMMASLKKWMIMLSKSLLNMFSKMEAGHFEKMKQKIEMYIKTFEDPVLDEHGHLIKKRQDETEKLGSDDETVEDLKKELALGEGVLKVNLGIPIVVVCNKVDLLIHGDKAKFLADNMDFIQKSVREYALQYGATVIFTSTITGKHLNTFYSYMFHRIYNYEFHQQANVDEKDNLFIPSGFDSLK